VLKFYLVKTFGAAAKHNLTERYSKFKFGAQLVYIYSIDFLYSIDRNVSTILIIIIIIQKR